MKYLPILLLLAACSKLPGGPTQQPVIIKEYYGADHMKAAEQWAAGTGENIHVLSDNEVVLLSWTPRQPVTDSATFRATMVLPLMKDCNKKTGIDHMELLVFYASSTGMYDYLFTAADFK